MDTSNFFYQSVTAHHFYVSSSNDLKVVDIQLIRGIRAYYVEWIYGGLNNRTFLSSDEMMLIVDAMGMFFGKDSESYFAWNSIYFLCLMDEKNEKLQSV